jgi:hypothetical protein
MPELQLGEVVHGHARPDGRGEDVDSLVHTGAADPLGSQERAVGGEARDQVHPLGARVVTRVVARVDVHHLMGDADTAQRRLVGPVVAAVRPKTSTIAVPRT